MDIFREDLNLRRMNRRIRRIKLILAKVSWERWMYATFLNVQGGLLKGGRERAPDILENSPLVLNKLAFTLKREMRLERELRLARIERNRYLFSLVPKLAVPHFRNK